MWYWGAPTGERVQRAVEAKKAREFERSVSPPVSADAAAATEYVDAVIEGNCERVVQRTEWLQARKKSLLDAGKPEAFAAEQARFCEGFFSRDAAGFAFAAEGIDDPYLFFPDVKYAVVGQDSGRPDLGVPVASRVWLEVSFPSPTRCLTDSDGRAISGLTVGLNLTPDGLIAKASVVGNAEIQWESLRYSW